MDVISRGSSSDNTPFKKKMIKIKFNKNKIIPNIGEYIEILIATMLVVYVFKSLLFKFFPLLKTLSAPWDLVVIVFLIFYFKNLFDIKMGGNDYF